MLDHDRLVIVTVVSPTQSTCQGFVKSNGRACILRRGHGRCHRPAERISGFCPRAGSAPPKYFEVV